MLGSLRGLPLTREGMGGNVPLRLAPACRGALRQQKKI